MADHINTTLKGLNLDVNELQNEGLVYSFALNATIENFSDPQPEPYRSNMASNVLCFQPLDKEKIVQGLFIPELNKTYIFTFNLETKTSRIIELTTPVLADDPYDSNQKDLVHVITQPQCKQRVILTTQCFNWIVAPRLAYKISDCEITFYAVNGIDEDRVFGFNTNTFAISEKYVDTYNCSTSIGNTLVCGKTKWNPEATKPYATAEVIAGNKNKGSYAYYAAYSTISGIPLTGFFVLTNNIPVFNLGKPSSIQVSDLNKGHGGIRLNLYNVSKDTRYKHLLIVVAETVNGVTLYKTKGIISTYQSQFIDVDNDGVGISITNITTQLPYYKSSSILTESNNILFRGNLSEYEKFNLQPLINTLELEWVTVVAPEGSYADPEFASNFIEFLRDEVYPLGIEITLDNLEKGPVFPLVGRKKRASDQTIVSTTTINCAVSQVERWQVENTATKSWENPTALSVLAYNCKKPEPFAYGDFAYWESSETYPNNPYVWGELCSKPIRHFKFPDVAISPHQNNNGSYDSKNYIFPIGVRLKAGNNLNGLFDQAVAQGLITQEQRNRITGFKLHRGNREGNKSIIAKGLMYDVWSYKRQAEKDSNFLDNCDTTVGAPIWTNQGNVYCNGDNSYQNQQDQFGNTRTNLVLINDLNCVVPQVLSLQTYTDDIWGVAHGQGGHHYLKLIVIITGNTPGNTLWVSTSGEYAIPFFNINGNTNFSFKFPHSNCCGNPGCGTSVTLEERDSTGVTVINTITNPPVALCSTDDLFSAQNPIVLTCPMVAGANQVTQVQSVPAIAGYTINAYLDGDSTYTSVASGVTNVSGVASITIPNTTNGQKYWFAATYPGYKESFGNSGIVGGACTNLVINAVQTCGVGGANVTFAPTGGSGTYSMSTNNNDMVGYNPLAPLFLPNGTNQVYIRDDADWDYKVMYSVVINC